MKGFIIKSLIIILFVLQLPIYPTEVSASFSPAPGIQVKGNRSATGIYYGTIQVEMNSGMEYSLNQGESWEIYTVPLSFDPPRGYSLFYRSIGNTNYETMNFAVKLDTIAPLTIAEILDVENNTGYFKNAIQVKLTALDKQSGVKSTQYSLDNGQNWLSYNGPISINDAQVKILYYRSIDNSGNVEISKKQKILLDFTPPAMPSIQIDSMQWTMDSVTVSINSGIDEKSGILKTEYKLDKDSQWLTYTNPIVISQENQIIYARSTDRAGNISEINEQNILVDKTAPNRPFISMDENWSPTSIPVSIDPKQDITESNTIRYQYKIGDLDDWQTYMSQFFINIVGETNIAFRSFDEAGNYSQVANKVARFDNIIPTPPTTLKVTNIKYNQVSLSWSGATDNIGLSGYEIYSENGELIGSSDINSYTVKNLQANKKYKFVIQSQDKAYNNSLSSDEIEVTTTTRPDFQSDGYFFMALRSDGSLWSWGGNEKGQLGNGTINTRSTPKKITSISNIKKIATGKDFTLAQKTDGTVWGWGGSPVNSKIPKQIDSFQGAEKIIINNKTIFVIDKNQSLWGWGNGTLYGAEDTDLKYPTQLNLSNIKNVQIDALGKHILALTNQGTLWTWGESDKYGQLGSYPSSNSYDPSQIKVLDPDGQVPMPLTNVEEIEVGYRSNFTLMKDGTIKAWGYDTHGALGMNNPAHFKPGAVDNIFSKSPVNVLKKHISDGKEEFVPLDNITDIGMVGDHGFAVDANGTIWGWGSNSIGQLGLPTGDSYYYATDIGMSDTSKVIVPDQALYSLALKKDHSLWGWGENTKLQLGLNGRSDTNIPPSLILEDVDMSHGYSDPRLGPTRPELVTVVKSDETFWMIGSANWNGTKYFSYSNPKQLKFGNESLPSGDNPTTPVTNNDDGPSQPKNLTLTDKGVIKAGIHWETSIGQSKIKEYLIFVDNDKVGTSLTNNYLLTGLEPEHSYSITIEAIDEDGFISELSEPLIIKTLPDIPSKPINLNIKDQTLHGFQLDWDASTSVSKIKEYIIYENGKEIARSIKPKYIVENLRSGETYNYTIEAVNEAEKVSLLSEPIAVILKSDIPTPPLNLKSSNQTATTINLSWAKSTSQSVIEKYSIYVDDKEVATTLDTFYTLSNLDSSKSYKITVIAMTNEGYASLPSIIFVPLAPTTLKVTDIDMYTKELAWNTRDQENLIKNYNIYLNGTLYKTVKEKNVLLENLIPEQKYKIYVSVVSTTDSESIPSQELTVSTTEQVIAPSSVFALSFNSAWIKKDNSLWMWGDNIHHQLGDGTTMTRSQAIRIGIDNVKQVISGGTNGRGLYTLAVKEDGTLWGWGLAYDKGLGDLGVKAITPKPITLNYEPINSVKEVVAIGDMNYLLKKDGTIWRFGGLSTDLKKIETIDLIDHIVGKQGFVFALKKDGTVWQIDQYSETRISGLTEMKKISSFGNRGFGLRKDGTVWQWNFDKEISKTSVQKVSGISQVIQIATGNDHVVALKTNGTIWTWGENSYGQLGDGSTNSRNIPAQVPDIGIVTDIAADTGSTLIIKEDDSAWAWGWNNNGQLGDGTTTDRLNPVQINENLPPTMKLISPNGTEMVPNNVSGKMSLISWEQSDKNQSSTFYYKQIQILNQQGEIVLDSGELNKDLTSNINDNIWTPTTELPIKQKLQVRVRVKNGSVWSEWSKPGWFIIDMNQGKQGNISSGIGNFMTWLKSDGTVWTWGQNIYEQLGQASGNDKTTAIPMNISEAKATYSGSYMSFVVKNDGSLWYWGDTNKVTKASNITDVTSLALNSGRGTSYVLKKDGTVWEFSIGSPNRFTKVNIDTVKAMEVGLALKEDGTVWSINGSSVNKVNNLTEIVNISTNTTMYYAVKADGTLWAWGRGYLGNGNETTSNTPVQVKNLENVIAVSTRNSTLALKADGTVWSWGYNDYGQLGDGTSSLRTLPVQVKGINTAIQVSAGTSNGAAILSDGTAWTWGYNGYGQLGNGTKKSSLSPVQVKENEAPKVSLRTPNGTESDPNILKRKQPTISWDQYDSAVDTGFSHNHIQILDANNNIIMDSGEISSENGVWNTSSTGNWVPTTELPTNQKLQVRVQVKDELLWSEWSTTGWFIIDDSQFLNTSVDAGMGNFMTLVKADGTVWGWGERTTAQPRETDIINKTNAIPLNINNIRMTNSSQSTTFGITKDGKVYYWGRDGMLMEVKNLNNVESLAINPIPSNKSYALKQDGTIWTFGATSPENNQKINITSVKEVAAGLALRNDGTVWNLYSSPSPSKIPQLNDIVHITAGEQTNYALKSNGTVWVWGRGYLGNGSQMNSTNDIPVQVKELNDVIAISASPANVSYSSALALKSDGTIWSWGYNEYGQLGDGTNILRTSPVQVKGIIGAVQISAGTANGAAVLSDGTVWTWGNNSYGQLGNGTKVHSSLPVQIKPNEAPKVVVKRPNGTENNPTVLTRKQPAISWNQQDAADTIFDYNQVQILDEQGKVIMDTGEVLSENSRYNTSVTGNWTSTVELPTNKKLQIKVRVKDKNLWSEWSVPTWFIVRESVATGLSASVSTNAGYYMTLTKADGTLWGWGSSLVNTSGPNKTMAVPLDVKEVLQTYTNEYITFLVKTDHSLWYGRSGSLITQATNISNVESLSLANKYGYVLKGDGTVWKFDIDSPNIFTKISINSVIDIAGEFATKSDGTVWSLNSSVPSKLSGLEDINSIFSNTSTNFAIKSDSTVWAWGKGYLGNGNQNGSNSPIQLKELTNITQISVSPVSTSGSLSVVALKKDGTVWSWGDNSYGQLGDSTRTSRMLPVQVYGIKDAVQVSAGLRNGAAVLSNGTVWTWGSNSNGQLGNGTKTDSIVPVQVKENEPPKVIIRTPSGSESMPSILTRKKPIFIWNQYDTAKDTGFSHQQIQVLNEKGDLLIDSGELSSEGGLYNYSSIGSWAVANLLPINQKLQVKVRVKDGMLWSEWSTPGWFVINDTMPATTTVSTGLGNYMTFTKLDGTVWGWGENRFYQLGEANGTTKLSAMPLNITDVQQTYTSNYITYAVKKNGSLWYWGNGKDITQANNISDVESLALNRDVGYVLKNDGTVWKVNLNAPNNFVQISINSVIAVTDGFALRANGTVWSLNTTTPSMVSDLTDIVAIASSAETNFAVKSDGTVLGWGTGYLGNGSRITTPITTPVQIQGLSNIKAIAVYANGPSTAIALKGDGTVWSWGENGYGELGDGTIINRTTPVKVKGITNAIQISTGGSKSAAVLADKTVWTWGYNSSGQLGDGTTVHKSTPVQVQNLK